MIIRPVGAESCYMRTDVRTGMTKLTPAFRNFANAPKNPSCYLHIAALSSYNFEIFILVINQLNAQILVS